jgi:hypothetical protein
MPRISTDNYDTVASWNGSQDLFVVEQPDGTKVATPAMVKQFIEAGDFEATGEIKDGHGNVLKAKQDTLTIVDISSQATIDTTKVQDFKAYTYGKLICISLRLKPGITDQTVVVSGLPYLIGNSFLVLPMFHMNAADASTEGVCMYAGDQIQYRGSTTQGANGTVYSGTFLLA